MMDYKIFTNEIKKIALLIEKTGYCFSDIKLKVLLKLILNKKIDSDLLDNFLILIIKGVD